MKDIIVKDAVSLDAKVVKVTLLEDRAMVQRTGTVTLEPGQHKLLVKDVAPVLQDLSLRAQAKGAKVVDARVRRAILVTSDEKPEQAKALEKDVDALTEKVKQLSEDRALTHQRRIRLEEILERGFSELPEDVSWGLSAPQWKESLEGLYAKVRSLRERAHSLDPSTTASGASIATARCSWCSGRPSTGPTRASPRGSRPTWWCRRRRPSR